MNTPFERWAHQPDLDYDARIGLATARRTYLRKTKAGYETRAELARRVAAGNVALVGGHEDEQAIYDGIRTGRLAMAGRHLQHGDDEQPNKNLGLHSNCSTAPLTSALFLLLLNGSGVGRAYNDEYMLVDWTRQPRVQLVLNADHADHGREVMDCPWPEATHSSPVSGDRYLVVADTREGWAKAVEALEEMTYEGASDQTLVLDFSNIRPEGAPIMGMQGRPASGPVPLMHAITKIQEMRGQEIPRWQSTMMADHELASVVAVGGARRAARIATKRWDDPEIEGFIRFKRDYKVDGKVYYNSSNNSVMATNEFWSAAERVFSVIDIESLVEWGQTEYGPWVTGYKRIEPDTAVSFDGHQYSAATFGFTDRELHAANAFLALSFCSYYDGTGEPGVINADKFPVNHDGLDEMIAQAEADIDSVVGFDGGYRLGKTSAKIWIDVAKQARKSLFPMTCNPCAEIILSIFGGYCVLSALSLAGFVRGYQRIGERLLEDVEAELVAAAELLARFLVRVNRMPALWSGETRRTNRIGVGLTGLHEFVLAQFGDSFDEMLSDDHPVWGVLERVSQAVDNEAKRYANELGMSAPHTTVTIPPAGTISKLDNITEGAHLPAKLRYLRNVQFQSSDPLIARYADEGYPTARLTSSEYKDITIVGFPTKPFIVELAEGLGLEDKLTTAPEVPMDEQYLYLERLEQHWISGGGAHPGNSVSYTAKYNAAETTYADFASQLFTGHAQIRCCSVMPEFPVEVMPNPYPEVEALIIEHTGRPSGEAPFEYVPEQILTPSVFSALEARVFGATTDEDIGIEHLECGPGGCPITFQNEVELEVTEPSTTSV